MLSLGPSSSNSSGAERPARKVVGARRARETRIARGHEEQHTVRVGVQGEHGVGQLESGGHDSRQARDQAVYPPLLVGSIGLLLVGVLAFALASHVTRPIRRLRS